MRDNIGDNIGIQDRVSGPDFLRQHTGVLRTGVGAAFPGSHAVFRGHNLHRDLQQMEWVALYAYGVTGRQLPPEHIEMVQALWVSTSYPDARLWNNRVAALAANARSSANLGMIAGAAVSEATVYGGKAALRAMRFLQTALARVQAGETVEDVVWAEVERTHIYGYGRPISSTDERIPVVMAVAERLGMRQGPHLTLAFEIEKVLLTRYPQLRMNFAAPHAALVADMGLTLRQYQLLRVPVFLGGMAPCVAEAMEKPEGTLFPTPCGAVAYNGPAARPWMRR
jgi:hypothetical protein